MINNYVSDYEKAIKYAFNTYLNKEMAEGEKTPLHTDSMWHSILDTLTENTDSHTHFAQAARWLDENGHKGLSRLFDITSNRLLDRPMSGRYDEHSRWSLPFHTHNYVRELEGVPLGMGNVMSFNALNEDGEEQPYHNIRIVSRHDPAGIHHVLNMFADRGAESFRRDPEGKTDTLSNDEIADIRHSLMG